MAIAVNATRRASGQSASVDSFTIALTSTPTAGCMLLISIVAASDIAIPTSMTDSYGNVYAQVFESGNHTLGVRAALWVCNAQHDLVSGDLITVVSNNITRFCYAVDEATGLGTAHVPDVTVGTFDAAAVSAFSTGASAATGYANELVWAVIGTPVATATTQTITAGTGYTQQGARVTGTGVASLYVEYKIVSGTGAQTADGTINTTASKYAARLATFPDPQSPNSTYRAVSAASAEDAAVVGVNRGVSFVGVEVAGDITVAAPSAPRRPSPIVAG
jgi:asparagine N-glycosylation enzyme membrane subunit Stt3